MLIYTDLYCLSSNRLIVNTVVSGRYGPKEFSRPDAKRQTATQIIGHVTAVAGPNEYEVIFQNGETIRCPSSKLTVVPEEEIPPTLRSDCNDMDDNGSKSDSDSNDYEFSGEEDIDEEEDDFECEEEEEVEEEEEDLTAQGTSTHNRSFI